VVGREIIVSFRDIFVLVVGTVTGNHRDLRSEKGETKKFGLPGRNKDNSAIRKL